MANVTITTPQASVTKLDLGDYYPSSVDQQWHLFPNDGWGICKKKVGGEEGIELHIDHEDVPFYLTHQSGLTYFLKVDTVNSVAPSSLDNLAELLLSALTS